MSIRADLQRVAERWKDADAGERANAQLYRSQLTRALDVPEPQPEGSGYEFERQWTRAGAHHDRRQP